MATEPVSHGQWPRDKGIFGSMAVTHHNSSESASAVSGRVASGLGAAHPGGRQDNRGQGGQDPGGLPVVRRANRAKAYKAAQRHTALVRLLRVCLPVLAFASIGLYAFNARLSLNVAGGTATVDRVELSTDNLRMVTPRLEGVTDDNGRYVVQAKAGTQDFDSPDIINLEEVDARVARPNDQWVHLVADTGRYETKAEKMQLKGNIRIVANNGMDARLQSARIDIKGNKVVSTDPVRIDMPNGHIDSQSVLIDTGAKTISFVGRVRVQLFKRPQNAPVTE